MLNNVTMMGRLVKDPEFKTIGGGTPVAQFTIACDREYAAKGEEKQTDFFDCTAWRGTAEFVNKFFTKGRMIAITGRLQTESYEAKDGTTRKVTKIVADRVSFCGDKGTGSGSTATSASKVSEPDPDELPF